MSCRLLLTVLVLIPAAICEAEDRPNGAAGDSIATDVGTQWIYSNSPTLSDGGIQSSYFRWVIEKTYESEGVTYALRRTDAYRAAADGSMPDLVSTKPVFTAKSVVATRPELGGYGVNTLDGASADEAAGSTAVAETYLAFPYPVGDVGSTVSTDSETFTVERSDRQTTVPAGTFSCDVVRVDHDLSGSTDPFYSEVSAFYSILHIAPAVGVVREDSFVVRDGETERINRRELVLFAEPPSQVLDDEALALVTQEAFPTSVGTTHHYRTVQSDRPREPTTRVQKIIKTVSFAGETAVLTRTAFFDGESYHGALVAYFLQRPFDEYYNWRYYDRDREVYVYGSAENPTVEPDVDVLENGSEGMKWPLLAYESMSEKRREEIERVETRWETVAVPAGIYRALRRDVVESADGIPRYHSYWVVPGIGTVKSETRDSPTSSPMYQMELVAFVPGSGS